MIELNELPSKEKFYELYWEKEMSLNQVSDELEISSTTVHRAMDKYDIPRRSVSEGTSLARGGKNRVKKICENCGEKFEVKPYRKDTKKIQR